MEEKQKYALVTGGSSGIGFELSKLLAKDGYSLIVVAKPQDELDRAKAWFDQNMPNTKIVYFQQDLAIPRSAEKVYNFTTQNGYDIEVLINNAGFGAFGWHQNLEMERELSMLNLNVVSNWQLTRLYLKDMEAKNRGKILITSSAAAFIPCPTNAVYAASKAFSYYYGLAYNQELIERGSNVSITVSCPPPTRTGFAKVAGMEHTKSFEKPNRMTKDAYNVAKEAYEALKAGKRMVIPAGGFAGYMIKFMNPLASPRRVVQLMKLAIQGSK